MTDIVRAAGLSNQAFYRHFKGKDELLLVLLEDGRERLAATIERRMARASGDAGRVRAWIEAVLAQACDVEAAEATRSPRGARPATERSSTWWSSPCGGAALERELLITGIGGQGVQLAAQMLARGATLDGKRVMLFGVYAGAMWGMNTEATVVIGDGPRESPPLVSHTWAAIGMHDKFWPPVERKLRDDALVLVNDATFDAQHYRVVRVPATSVKRAHWTPSSRRYSSSPIPRSARRALSKIANVSQAWNISCASSAGWNGASQGNGRLASGWYEYGCRSPRCS